MCKTSQAVPEQQGQNAPQLDRVPATSSRPVEPRPMEPRRSSDHNPYSAPRSSPEVESNFETPKGRFPGWAVVGCLLVSVLITFVLLIAVLGIVFKFA